MVQTVLKIKKLTPDAIIPRYATAGAACFDIHTTIKQDCLVQVGKPVLCPTGLSFEIPAGWVMLVFSRSGHGFKHSTRLANCVGVIDSDYRGELMVRLNRDNDTVDELLIAPGDRIAQAMLVPAIHVDIEEVAALSATERGTGGLGSTGK